MGGESCTMLSDFFADSDQFYGGVTSPDDIFGILEALDGGVSDEFGSATTPTLVGVHEDATTLGSQKSIKSTTVLLGALDDKSINGDDQAEGAAVASQKSKKRKVVSSSDDGVNSDYGGMQHNKISHITVERNRRKQMNEHLTVLRSLMPCFYVKRGDQASIIGGVVDYISELQQVLQSLEAKKQRKVYSEVLSPRINVSSPRPNNLPISPRKPPISPRIPCSLPISPRTPQPASPAAYRPHRLHHPTTTGYLSPSKAAATIITTTTPTQLPALVPSPSSSSTNSSNINDTVNELVANSKSTIADVEVKFSGPNLLLKTLSPRLPCQATRIISALDDLSLEILHANISTNDETMVNSFTLKIGIECQLSAEELAHHVQQTFC